MPTLAGVGEGITPSTIHTNMRGQYITRLNSIEHHPFSDAHRHHRFNLSKRTEQSGTKHNRLALIKKEEKQ